MSGPRYGLLDGQALLCLNSPGLTLQERGSVKKLHSALFNDDYLSPSKASAWLHKGKY